MKKLVLAALAVVALFAMEADARYYRNYRNCGACETKCSERIVEEACPQPPCCVKYARVTFPAKKVKHVSYSWECPTDCNEEQTVAAE